MNYEVLQNSQSTIDASRLRNEAKRCYRLANGIAGVALSNELEAIGRAFEREAEFLEARGFTTAAAPLSAASLARGHRRPARRGVTGARAREPGQIQRILTIFMVF
jgi:hypothetical protein